MIATLARATVLVATAATAACAATGKEPAWSPARLAPAGWAQDFDYRSDLATYLRVQYDRARQDGATAYVYFYSDSSSHCLGTRRVMSRPEVASALGNVTFTMLNADRLKWLHDQGVEGVMDPGEWVPVIARIAANGTLAQGIFLPDVPLYHTDPRKSRRVTMQTGRDGRLEVRRFVEELQKYLQSRNETDARPDE